MQKNKIPVCKIKVTKRSMSQSGISFKGFEGKLLHSLTFHFLEGEANRKS